MTISEPTTMTKAERTQRRIVEVAISQFADRGIRATSIASVAKAAGVSPASVFGYFGSKEELFHAAADTDTAAIVDEVGTEFLTNHADTDLHDRWSVLWRLFDDSLGAHPLLKRMLTDPETPVYARMLALPSVRAAIDLFTEEITAAQASGTARPDIDARVAADGLTTTMIGVVLTHSQMGIASRPDRLDAMLTVLNSTLRRAEAGQSTPAPTPTTPVPRPTVNPPDTVAPEALTKGARTRERILDVAVQLFAVTGSKGTSVAQIAREVGITPAAVFAHFASKDELFEAAFERDAWAMVMGTNSAMADIKLVDRWPDVINVMWDNLDKYPLVQRVIFAKELDRVTQLLDSEAMRVGVEGMRDNVLAAQEKGQVRSDNPAAVLAEGLIDLASCLMVAQAQADEQGTPPRGWDERLAVIGLALRPETV